MSSGGEGVGAAVCTNADLERGGVFLPLFVYKQGFNEDSLSATGTVSQLLGRIMKMFGGCVRVAAAVQCDHVTC